MEPSQIPGRDLLAQAGGRLVGEAVVDALPDAAVNRLLRDLRSARVGMHRAVVAVAATGAGAEGPVSAVSTPSAAPA